MTFLKRLANLFSGNGESFEGSIHSELFPELQKQTERKKAEVLERELREQNARQADEQRLVDIQKLYHQLDPQVRRVFQDYSRALGYQGKIISDPIKRRWYWGDPHNPVRDLSLNGISNKDNRFFFVIVGEKYDDIWDRTDYKIRSSTNGHTIKELIAMLSSCEKDD